jgi:hypothetical protein
MTPEILFFYLSHYKMVIPKLYIPSVTKAVEGDVHLLAFSRNFLSIHLPLVNDFL